MSATFPIAFGRYQLVERLAVGGMAELFLADVQGEHGFAKRVVIKRILPQLAADPHFTAMFIAEAKITARLIHPKIAQTHRLGHQAGALYIEMEYVDGLDVLAMLRECAHRRVRLPAEVSVYIMKEVLDGLDFAHRLCDERGRALDVVHRDISPSNVLVSRRGNVKLVDFGIAQAAANEQQTKAGTLKGKYGYMSPEQVSGAGVSARSDLFSVGIVLSEMLMGRRLFAAPNELDVLLMVRDVNLSRLERYGAHVPPALDALLRRALTKDPGGRFESAAEMREALDEWLFESRLRVGAGRVGELIESLYDDAHSRRRAGLEDAPLPPMQSIAPPPALSIAGEVGRAAIAPDLARPELARPELPRPELARPELARPDRMAAATPPRAASDTEIEGIPAGRSMVLGGSDALSEVEIELAMPAGSARDLPGIGSIANEKAPIAPARSRRALSGGPPPREPDDDLALSEEIDIDLSGLDAPRPSDNGSRLPSRDAPSWQRVIRSWSGTGPPPRAGTATARDADDGIPISVEDQETHRVSTRPGSIPPADAVHDPQRNYLRETLWRAPTDSSAPPVEPTSPDHAVRFPTIRAAVASVSPARRDPASRDFDDTGVPGLMGAAEDIRSGRMRMPSLAELARAPRPAPPALDEIAETPAQQGDLADISPIRLLFQLVTTRADGLLVVAVGGIRKEIYIRGGVPTYVSSNVASELFGAYLVGEGAVSSGELDMALAMMPHFGGKLGDTLVGLGLMKPLDVFRLLTRQIRHKLIDVCTWSKGLYTWYQGRENQREAFPIDLDPYEVLGAGALALRDDFLWKWSESVHEMRPRAAERPQVRPEQLKIGRVGREVLSMLDGRATVSELIARRPGPDERLQLLRVLFLFLETGLAIGTTDSARL